RYYARADLDRVRQARNRLVKVPAFYGLTYLGDAAPDLGVSTRTLRRLMAAERPVVRVVKKTARSADGRALPRSYVPTSCVEKVRASRRQDPVPADMMTVEEAAAELDCATVTVHALVRKGLLQAKMGRKLVDAEARDDVGRGLRYPRKATLVSRADV